MPKKKTIYLPWLPLAVAALLLGGPARTSFADDADRAALLRKAGATSVEQNKAGQVTKLFFKDSSKITPEQWKVIGQLAHARSMTFYNQCTLSDETLPLLAGLDHLEEFACDGMQISDKGLAGMTKWANVKKITFFHPSWKKELNFTGSGLAAFKDLKKLQSFGVGGALFNDAGMAAVGKLTQLHDLQVWHTRNTPAGNSHLEKLTNLRSLYYSPDPKTAAAAVPSIAKLDRLEKLTLLETRLTAGQLEALGKLKRLKTLELQEVEISPADLATVKEKLPGVAVKWTAPKEHAQGMIRRAFDAK